MSANEMISFLAEFLSLQSTHQNLDVLIHNFETENRINRMQYNDESFILSPEQTKFLDSFKGFLSIRNSSEEYARFRNYCNSENENRNELKKRIREIEENPEIGISAEEVRLGIEEILGKKISIPSRSK